jgi:hypothetical protein
MRFTATFFLNGVQHHTRDYSQQEHADEAITNWKAFGEAYTAELLDREASTG